MYRDTPPSDSGDPATIYTAEHDWDGPARLSTTVIHLLSDALDLDVTNSGFSLNDSIDPSALDTIFRPKADGLPREGGHVAFTVRGSEVTVYSDGYVEVAVPAPSESRRPPNTNRRVR
ncbi:HalOD1 output domain-containing protein [Halobacteriaceae archaeon GCM10025711]